MSRDDQSADQRDGSVRVACPNCGHRVPLVKGMGPVGRKTFRCPRCDETFRFDDD
jgi:uncharacterized C2H2 Zn-finger protein